MIVTSLPWGAKVLIFVGEVFVTAGAIVYRRRLELRRWKDTPGYHEIFHLTTLIAAALNFAAIWFYLLPARQ